MTSNSNFIIARYLSKEEIPIYLVCTDYKFVNDYAILSVPKPCEEYSSLFQAMEAANNLGFREKKEEIPIRKKNLLAPFEQPKNMIGVAWNYYEHQRETGYNGLPTFFPINPKSISKPFSSISINSRDLMDYEIEIGLILGKPILKGEKVADVRKYILGYFLANDITSRRIQVEQGRLWWKTRGFYDSKNMPHSKPCGPFISPILNTDTSLELVIERAGKSSTRQKAEVSQMRYTPLEIVEYLTHLITHPLHGRQKRQTLRATPSNQRLWNGDGLYSGDIILTGTPSGIAFRSSLWDIILAGGKRRFLSLEEKNQDYLQRGDKVIGKATGFGRQEIHIT